MNKKLARQLAVLDELTSFMIEHAECPECGEETCHTVTGQSLEMICPCGWSQEFNLDDTNEAAVRY